MTIEALVFVQNIKLNLLKMLLGPMLLYQGARVRKHTPLLPEPVIEPVGQVGSGPAMSLLLLGDSSAAGVGAKTAEQTLLGHLIRLLGRRFTLQYKMLAATGKTSVDALAEISQLEPACYDVVLTALGVNDVTSQVALSDWQSQQQELIALIKNKFAPRQLIMSGLPPVGEFPALPWPLNRYLGAYANALNQILIEITTSEQGVFFHSLRGYPKVATAASDGFHPGPKVYELWAEYLVDVIDKP